MTYRKRVTYITKSSLKKVRRGRVGKKITLICTKQISSECKKMKGRWVIRTNFPEKYTEEVKKSWVCVLCAPYIKKGAK